MFSGMGSPNFCSITEILRVEGLSERKDILEKIMIYILASLRESQKTRKEKVITNKSKKSVRK